MSFVRKRDKRVQAYKKVLEERAELNRKKQEQNRLERIRKRQRELEEMRPNHKQIGPHNNDEYEAQLKQLAQNYGDSSAEEESETDDEEERENEDVLESANEQLYVDELYCVACNKVFKNENAYANHETSKKHREAVERIKLELQAEESAFLKTNEDEEHSVELQDSEVEELETDNSKDDNPIEYRSEMSDSCGNVQADHSQEETDSRREEELFCELKSKKNKKSRRNKLNKSQLQPANEDDEETLPSDFLAEAKLDTSDENDWNNRSKKSVRKNKIQEKKTMVEEKGTKCSKPYAKIIDKTDVKIVTDDTDESVPKFAPRITEKFNKIKEKENTDSSAISHVCVTCHANFQSKNKLFAHLKMTNHGVYIPKAKTQVNATSPEGKNKKTKAKRK